MSNSARLTLVPIFVAFCVAAAAKDGASNGPGALALAAIVSESSPLIGAPDKRLLASYFDGRANAPHAKGKTIAVKADAIDCRVSNVDITERSCELTFGEKKVSLRGRRAHELYATLVENGAQPDGAAGSMHASVSALDCLIDADEVADKAGGGARCAFDPPR